MFVPGRRPFAPSWCYEARSWTVRHQQTVTSLDDLTVDRRNPNQGTSRGQSALAESLEQHGAARSIVVDRHGHIVSGNKVAAAARTLKLPVQVVRTTGDQLVIVQRADLDLSCDPKARALALADNRTAELNLEWDPELLRAFADEGVTLEPWWTPEELEQLCGHGLGTGHTADDAVVEPPPSTIQRGDLFALGEHRLLCGDATDRGDVTRVLNGLTPILMTTDPPYGVEYDPRWRAAVQPQAHTAVGAVANDDRCEWRDAYALFPGAVSYVWHAGVHAAEVAWSLRGCGFQIRAQIVWAKQHFAFSRGHYHWQHEPCWYAVREGHAASWRGSRTQTTVWQVPNLNPHGGHRDGEDAVTGHSTQKPVRLFEIPILNHTRRGDGLYDPFCGSGTAIIAAEKTGRRCMALDIDPQYVQATIQRWEAFTGHRAVQVA